MTARKPKKNERKDKKAETVHKRKLEQQEKLLSIFEKTPVIHAAVVQAGIHRSTYYDWRNADEEFAKKSDEARSMGKEFISDMAESVLINLIKKENMTAIIFWLKNHSREYMEIHRYQHFHEHEFKENPLTEERKRQIAEASSAWSSNDYKDERKEDYDVRRDKDGNPLD